MTNKLELIFQCLYKGRKSFLTVKQGCTDLVFKVGKMSTWDSITGMRVKDGKIEFHGLYKVSLLNPIEISTGQAATIGKSYKVRVLSRGKEHGTMFCDSTVTSMRIASKGAEIYNKVIDKRGANAAKYFSKRFI